MLWGQTERMFTFNEERQRFMAEKMPVECPAMILDNKYRPWFPCQACRLSAAYYRL